MKSFAPVFCALASATALQASTLVSWDFTGNNPADNPENSGSPGSVVADAATYATTFTGLTTTDYVLGGTSLFSQGRNPGSDPVYTDEINVRTFDIGGNGTADGWNEFTLSGAGDIEITEISMSLWRNGAGAPNGMVWEVSIDGGAFTQFGATSVENNLGDKTFRTHTFTDAASATDNVTFRFAPRNAGAGSTGNIHINAISVEGSFTPIPEPGSALLAGVGLLCLARRRRRS